MSKHPMGQCFADVNAFVQPAYAFWGNLLGGYHAPVVNDLTHALDCRQAAMEWRISEEARFWGPCFAEAIDTSDEIVGGFLLYCEAAETGDASCLGVEAIPDDLGEVVEAHGQDFAEENKGLVRGDFIDVLEGLHREVAEACKAYDLHCEQWLSQKEVSVSLELKKWEVSRLCATGVLRTNGLTRKACRVAASSIVAYCKANGIAFEPRF